MIVPLYVSSENRKVAVLTPREVRILEEYMNADYKIRTRFLLHTAMRIAEAKYVDLNRNAFRKENGAIFLPKVKGLGKKKCTISNRTVLLSHVGVSAVEDFFDKNVHLPSYQAMEQALKLAAREADFDDSGITTKMYRKIIISWLIQCFPERETAITKSAGHDPNTMRGHYLTSGFRKDDIREMRELLEGWGEAR